MLPNFICVGAQKAGTTSLYDLLKQHPDIYLSEKKETKFFFKTEDYNKGTGYYREEFFYRWNGQKVVGEMDPEYMYFEYVAERIYKTLGKDLKLIFMLRNPVERAFSQYLMTYRRGYEKESFEKAIELENERIQKGDFEKSHFSYVDRGFYSRQIKRYLEYFPMDVLKFVIFEEFINNKPEVLREIYTFLEVDDFKEINLDIKSNPASEPKSKFLRDFLYHPPELIKKIGKVFLPSQKIRRNIGNFLDQMNQKPIEKPKLNPKTRILLMSTYESDIAELEKLINKNLSFWFKNSSV